MAMDQSRMDKNSEILENKSNTSASSNYEDLSAISDKLLEKGFSIPTIEAVHSRFLSADDDTTALHIAAKEGKLPAAQLLIDKGFDINITDNVGRTPLYEAAYWGRETMVRFLVDRGADILCRTKKDGWLVIHIAAARGHRTIVKYLLERGVDVNDKNYDDKTALFEASRWGQDAVVGFLIGKGGDIRSFTKNDGWQPIHIAAAKGHGTIVKILLDKGIDVNIVNFDDRTPLFEASYWGHDSVVRLLLNRSANVSYKTKMDGWSPLHAAAARGHDSIVKLLLDSGADKDIVNHDGRTPLFEASYWGREEVVRLLVERKADLNAPTNSEGWQPIHASAAKGHVSVTEILLDNGVNVDAANYDGRTPLFEASYWGRDEVVWLLIGYSADIHAKTNADGWMAIHIATSRGHISIVRLLLDNGVTVDAKNYDDRTPLMEAARWGHIEIVKMLIDWGADISAASKKSGWTALHRAAAGGQTDVVLVLLEMGGNPNVRSKEYKTPLYEAVTCGHFETSKVLIENGANKVSRTTSGETILDAAKASDNIKIRNLF